MKTIGVRHQLFLTRSIAWVVALSLLSCPLAETAAATASNTLAPQTVFETVQEPDAAQDRVTGSSRTLVPQRKFTLRTVALITFITAMSLFNAQFPLRGPAPAVSAQEVEAVRIEAMTARIVDGDTIDVVINGEKTRVRLLGIDTPESTNNKRARKFAKEFKLPVAVVVAMGKQSKTFVKDQLHLGDTVFLELDEEKIDNETYKRLLAYVFLQDGRMLNLLIVEEGFAGLLTVPPNIKHEREFLEAYEKAKQAKKGLWFKYFLPVEKWKPRKRKEIKSGSLAPILKLNQQLRTGLATQGAL